MGEYQYFAHSPQGNQQSWELLVDHAKAVAKKTAEFAKDFNFEDLGEIAGLFHDIGKYQMSFQSKLKGVKNDIEHSFCGAKEILKLLDAKENPISVFNREILAYVIAGHHSGLPNCGTETDNNYMASLFAKVNRMSEDYTAYKNEINFAIPKKLWVNSFNSYDNNEKPFAYSILTRMMYSALVDSDSLETEKFYNGKSREYNFLNFENLKNKLDTALNSFGQSTEGSINDKRNEIQRACLTKASNAKGMFSLTVPTGGGKTLSSMVFAINHLLLRKHKRIIYVIPYTAIIEQTANVFKKIFGEENVLEHHSNFTYEDIDDESTPKFLATENWDAPIILTTNVQFFESLFSNKRGSCRKVHNISNSVIILDEAQMLPISLLKPCLKTIDILTRNFECTALLMSATNPNYLPYMCKDAKVTEINESYKEHYEYFKRVDVQYIKNKTDEELINSIDKKTQTLIVVNSRKHAYTLYGKINADCDKYHLSTLMYPKHRRETIDKIRTKLANGEPCIVVSTQLIECGIDLDFSTVYRSLAGIDSIVQAGGRCNREGKRNDSKVYVFESSNDPKKGDIPIYKSIARSICENPLDKDIFSLKSINSYFLALLEYNEKKVDEKRILELFNLGKSPFFLQFDFAKCAEEFKYIDSANKYGIVVLINEEVTQIVNQIKKGFGDLHLAFRKLNQYTIMVYRWEYDQLVRESKLEMLNSNDRLSVLRDVSLYNKLTGLNLNKNNEDSNELFIV